MQTSLIDQGIDLMLYGMGTVFVFLTILVFATALMSRLVLAFSKPDLESDASGQADPGQGNAAMEASPQVLEVIKLAIKAHRQRP